MPWFRVDDTLHAHPKLRGVSLYQLGLWVTSGSYSAHYLLDGFVPRWYVNQFANGARSASGLVKAGLWYEDERGGETGWSFHDWDRYQPTKAQVERDREQARVRANKRRTSLNVRPDVRPDVQPKFDCPYPTQPDPLVVGLGNQPHQSDHSPAGATSAKSARAGPTPQPDNFDLWAEEIANCQLCDDEGMRLPDHAFKCDHIDRTQTNQNGSAAVREALNEAKTKRTAK